MYSDDSSLSIAHEEVPYTPEITDAAETITPKVVICAAQAAARAMGFHSIKAANPLAPVPRQDTRKEWVLIRSNGTDSVSMAVHCSPSSSPPRSPYTAAVLISQQRPVVLLEAKEGVTDHKVARELMLRAFVRWAHSLRICHRHAPSSL